jgi:hypothetical protein
LLLDFIQKLILKFIVQRALEQSAPCIHGDFRIVFKVFDVHQLRIFVLQARAKQNFEPLFGIILNRVLSLFDVLLNFVRVEILFLVYLVFEYLSFFQVVEGILGLRVQAHQKVFNFYHRDVFPVSQSPRDQRWHHDVWFTFLGVRFESQNSFVEARKRRYLFLPQSSHVFDVSHPWLLL